MTGGRGGAPLDLDCDTRCAQQAGPPLNWSLNPIGGSPIGLTLGLWLLVGWLAGHTANHTAGQLLPDIGSYTQLLPVKASQQPVYRWPAVRIPCRNPPSPLDGTI